MKKILIILATILVLGAGAFFGYRIYNTKNKTPSSKQRSVTRGNIVDQVIATGTVNPVTLVQVGSQVYEP